LPAALLKTLPLSTELLLDLATAALLLFSAFRIGPGEASTTVS
jgi:hypothetical protein